MNTPAKFLRLAPSVFCAVLLTGCAAPLGPMPPSGTQATIGTSDAEACEAAGGKIRNVCRRQMPACVIPYPDGGNRCTDNSQCKGKCLVDNDQSPAPDASVVGRCQRDNDPCGCKVEVVNGKVAGGACID